MKSERHYSLWIDHQGGGRIDTRALQPSRTVRHRWYTRIMRMVVALWSRT